MSCTLGDDEKGMQSAAVTWVLDSGIGRLSGLDGRSTSDERDPNAFRNNYLSED